MTTLKNPKSGERRASNQRNKYIEGRRMGLIPTQAARRAGYANAKQKAYELERNDELVIAAVKESEEETRKMALYTRETAIEDLKIAIDIAKKKTDAMGIARCVNELNRMHGWLAPEKKEFTHGLQNKPSVKQLEQLDEAKLLEKIGGEKGLTIDAEFEEIADE